MNMKTAEFNEDYKINRTARGVKATAKNVELTFLEIPTTADGTPYVVETVYHFFDESSRQIRQSTGFRRKDDHLCALGLKIVEVAHLHTNRDAALSDGQQFFNAEIEALRAKIRQYEAEKQPANRSLKAVLTSR